VIKACDVERKCGLEAFEAKQDAERFAGGGIGIDNMDEAIAVQKRMIVNLFSHLALRRNVASDYSYCPQTGPVHRPLKTYQPVNAARPLRHPTRKNPHCRLLLSILSVRAGLQIG
jgi:hypothetical protein